MAPRKQKPQLGDSWVVESEDESSSPSPVASPSPSLAPSTARRTSRRGTRSPDPEFVMPTVEASWGESSSRSTKAANRGRSGDGAGLRRPVKQEVYNGSPEKRRRDKVGREAKPTNSRLQKEPSSIGDVLEVVVDHGGSIVSWLIDVVGGALRVLKTPISYILAIWLLFGLSVMVRNLVTNSVYASLSPICRIPGVPLLGLPFCPAWETRSGQQQQQPVEFDQLMKVQGQFEEVLEDSAGRASLPLDMKRGEASIRDLRQLVRYSSLQSKNELVLEFDGFIETARIVSYDLQKFSSHVGRAVDSVISTTRWTARVLDGINERDAGRGSLSAFINDKVLAPFQPVKFTEPIVLDQYIAHTRVVEEELHKLIAEAQALLYVLQNLDDRLEVIHGISTRDGMHANAMKEEVLSQLWSMVGGNRSKLKNMDRQLALLGQVGTYRKNAMAHVSGTIIKLQAMGASLEDLRERVGAPELLRDRTDIPLSVHIENIQLGVERLEEGRREARKVEDDHVRKTLERGTLEGSMIES